jgi:heme-degrading monooxygenase HmoA
MIARIWHAWTEPQRAAAYESLLRSEIFPGLLRLEGFKGADLLRRESGVEVEFIVVTIFESLDALRRFAGEDFEQAVVSAKVKQLLARFDPRCSHFERLVRAKLSFLG